jgi:carbamoyltransferase
MTAILGISAFYHDSAAALVVDGTLAAAAQEERFSRKKHDERFPAAAVAFCLRQAGLSPDDLDYAVFYEKPFVKLDRLLETYLAHAPRGFRSFSSALPKWLGERMHIRRLIANGVGAKARVPLVFLDHHQSHAASAFFPSPFDEAAILTLDGVGEWSTASTGTGHGNRIDLDRALRFPHSLGLLYSAFTYYCGFRVNSGEYKLMGLAPFGKPRYAEAIRRNLIDIREDGSFRLDTRYFDFCTGLRMTGARFHALFGGPPRDPESRLLQRHADLAASIQQVTEEIVLRMANDLRKRTGLRHLVMAGGVALNAVANGMLLARGPFDDVWIQPAPGDAGASIGAALFVWHQLLGHEREPGGRDGQQGSFLGPAYGDREIAAALEAEGLTARRVGDERELNRQIAQEIASGRVVGWFQGRMEFGPRALGARSILADARSGSMQSTLNLKVKFRESFRPFAPIVLQEHVAEWFDVPSGRPSPYMLFVAPLLESRRFAIQDEQAVGEELDLIQAINARRSAIPAVTHVDYSARLQTVNAENRQLYGLMSEFHRLTGCPVMVNTSFNVRGEPIVCSPQDAIRCFRATGIDLLVLGNFVVDKTADGAVKDEHAREDHLARFALD